VGSVHLHTNFQRLLSKVIYLSTSSPKPNMYITGQHVVLDSSKSSPSHVLLRSLAMKYRKIL